MFRGVLSRVSVGFRHSLIPRVSLASVRSHSSDIIFDDEFDCKYQEYFSRPEIDHWEIRKAMNDLAGMDNIPHPKIIIAAMQACRRLNDFALAIRFLETCKEKCGPKVKEIYPYLLQEINPCLCELGIETPEELGYDKPELHLVSGFDYDCPALCP